MSLRFWNKPFEQKLECAFYDIGDIGNWKWFVGIFRGPPAICFYILRCFPKNMLWLWKLQYKHFVNMLLKNQTFGKYFAKKFAYKIWHRNNWNVKISNHLRKKFVSPLFDMRDIGNWKSRTWKTVVLLKLNLYDLPLFENRKLAIVFANGKFKKSFEQ